VSVIWRSVLNAHNRFAMAAIAPVMTPVVTIAAVIAGTPHFGVAALAAGTTLGATAELVALFGALRRSKIPAFPRLRWRSAEVARVLQQYWPIVVSSAVMGGSTIVDQTMAAMLGSGSVSALNFGTRVSGVLLAVGPAALSTALFPRLSAMSARGEWRDLGSMLRRYLLLGAVLTVPVACALAWLSEPIARVVFERGAFVPRDTRVVAAVQAFSFLQLPIAVALALLLRAVASLRANVVLIKVSVLALGANAALNYVLMHRMGVAGIALSTTAVHSLVLILAGTIVFRRLGSLVLFEGKHTSNVEVGDS
jgi:putative peptidoglycan lipid II flippase